MTEPPKEREDIMRLIDSAVVAVFVVAMILGAGCGKKAPTSAAPAGKPSVYTTFYPTQYFAERIGGDLIDGVSRSR